MSSVGLSGTVPSWPSLYDPGIELLRITHNDPVQPGGAYLTHPLDIFRFTLYWNLVFYIPIFLFCGLYAFFNLTFPPTPRTRLSKREQPSDDAASYPLMLRPYSPRDPSMPLLRRPKPKHNRRRSRTTFAILVFLTFASLSLAGAALGSAVVGFILAGIYKLAKFNMSTYVWRSHLTLTRQIQNFNIRSRWIPFLWSVISVLVGLLSLWPSVIDII
ncbi:hypothetical protein C8F04DRAFT_1257803 [Mycena alexandri]|uniref:Uncharacterized protein n=1 Tax=Mycena alexandri TaxID=1745969 RepID=A0AAD6X5S3_9AGAR|nr:hypothetical protein C8F04DRAFT_1257803 [Mycena alexandri]